MGNTRQSLFDANVGPEHRKIAGGNTRQIRNRRGRRDTRRIKNAGGGRKIAQDIPPPVIGHLRSVVYSINPVYIANNWIAGSKMLGEPTK